MPVISYLRMHTTGMALSLGLNGVPLAVDAAGRGLSTAMTVNEWLRAEGNRVDLELCWPRERPPLGPPRARVHLFLADPGKSEPTPLETLVDLSWPAPDGARDLPHRTSTRFELREPPPVAVWADAEPIEEVTEADRRRILGLAEDLRRALADRRTERAFDLGEYRFRDEARANGFDFERMRAGILGQYAMFLRDPAAEIPPLTERDARFAVVGDGRLVHVERDGGGEAVQVRGRDRIAGIPLYVARIGGEWRIAR